MGGLAETRGGCQYRVLKTVLNPPVPLQTVIFVVVELLKRKTVNLTFIGPCIANIFSEYNQQDAM